MKPDSRRSFLKQLSLGAGLAGVGGAAFGAEEKIQGFDDTATTVQQGKVWQPVSDRKVRVGIAATLKWDCTATALTLWAFSALTKPGKVGPLQSYAQRQFMINFPKSILSYSTI